jgi:hypothetical protein
VFAGPSDAVDDLANAPTPIVLLGITRLKPPPKALKVTRLKAASNAISSG